MSLPKEKVDAVIVGSGAAGSAMAAYLARAGKKVVVLEAGPDRGTGDLVSSTLWSRRLHWAGEPVLESGDNPIGHVFNAGYGVGGSTVHHFGVWPRFHPEDFEVRSRYDRALDWPISYADVQPWYDRVQRELGVSGDAGQETWRPPGEDYPMPPVPLFAQGEILARGFERMGMSVAPMPLAVTTQAFNGRPPCIWDGWCDAGCPIGAMAQPLVTHLPEAIANGAVLETGCTVTRILTSADGSRADGVEFMRPDLENGRVMADLVVLAAFAVQNPRLMLASENEHHPGGLANSSGLVGNYLMSHPGALIYGLFDEETECHMGATGGQLICQDAYAKDHDSGAGAFGSRQWMIAQASHPTDLLGIATTRPDLFGNDLHAFVQEGAHHFATMNALIEDLPVENNQVSLDSRKDRFGVPLAKTVHTALPETVKLWEVARQEGKAVFEAAGAKEIWTGPPAAMHIMGGTIMGADPKTSVCNAYGQTHDIPNLVVAGPGLFPSSAGVNPTFTVHALAARSSHHLLEQWGAIAA